MLQTAILFIKAHYAICGIFIAAYLLNLLVGHKSQVDAWCEKNPKLASLIKLIRGILPFDPWLIIQGIYLILTKKLPIKLLTVLTTIESTTELTTTTIKTTESETKPAKVDPIPPPPAA